MISPVPLQGAAGASVVLTPHPTSAGLIRVRHDARQRKNGKVLWDSPDILSFRGWLKRIWFNYVLDEGSEQAVLLTSTQERTLWGQIIAESKEADELLQIPETARQAASAWKLIHDWQIVLTKECCAFIPDAEAFFEWRGAFERRLQRELWVTAAQLPSVIAELFRSRQIAAPERITRFGWEECTKVEQALFEVLARAGTTIEESCGSAETRQSVRVRCETPVEEIVAAAAWTRERLNRQSDIQLAVIIPDLKTQRPIVERIFDEVLHPDASPGAQRAFHLSGGAPLWSVPLIDAALLALKLPLGLSSADAGRLLRSPFFSYSPELGADIDRGIRRAKLSRVGLDTRRFDELFPKFGQVFAACPQRQLPSRWSRDFSRILSKTGWPGARPMTTEESQAVDQWCDVLSEYAGLDALLGMCDYSSAFESLARLAAESHLKLPGGARPIQILEAEAALGARFDAMWIVGLHSGKWPAPPRVNPFLPLAVQRAAGVPHNSPDNQLEYGRRLIERLLASAPEAVCSFPGKEGDETREHSPLIDHLPEKEIPARFTLPTERIAKTVVTMEELAFDAAPPLSEDSAQTGGSTVIKNQAACPFRAFAIHRLNARALDEADIGLSNADRGNVVHKALEHLWRQLGSQRALLDAAPVELDQLIETSINAALTNHQGLPERLRNIERRRLKRQINGWLSKERARQPFEVVSTEAKESIEIEGLKLSIKADRVDRYEDGSLALVDYKTGKKDVSVKAWEGERPDAPQLPLYAITRKDAKVSEVFFARISAAKTELTGLIGQALEPHIARWEEVIPQIAREFVAGRADVAPKDYPNTCAYCDAAAICRVGERFLPGVAPEDSSIE